MKPSISKINVLCIIFMMLFLSSCNTVTGAFQGAGQDTKSAANALHLNN